MGYMRHHAIIVTTYKWETADAARDQALGLALPVSEIVDSIVNGYHTFVIGPDGSNEGWSDSDAGDEARAVFIAWMDSQRYEDGSTPFDWALIQYGDEDGDNRMLAHDDEPMRRRPGVLT